MYTSSRCLLYLSDSCLCSDELTPACGACGTGARQGVGGSVGERRSVGGDGTLRVGSLSTLRLQRHTRCVGASYPLKQSLSCRRPMKTPSPGSKCSNLPRFDSSVQVRRRSLRHEFSSFAQQVQVLLQQLNQKQMDLREAQRKLKDPPQPRATRTRHARGRGANGCSLDGCDGRASTVRGCQGSRIE